MAKKSDGKESPEVIPALPPLYSETITWGGSPVTLASTDERALRKVLGALGLSAAGIQTNEAPAPTVTE